MIATAVKFLQNPKVTKSPLSQKKAFLERKGLTKDEVDAAIARSGIVQADTPGPALEVQQPAPGTMVPYQSAGPPLPARLEASPYSKWSKMRDVLAVVTMVTGVSYAAYRLYQEFLRPLLFGIPSSNKRLEKLEKSLQETLTKVNDTLVTVQDALTKQQEKLQMISHDIYSKTGNNGMVSAQSTQNIVEIKSELSSLKGLLLNRRQFPPVPTTSPVLPSWQLASSGEATSKDEVKGNSAVTLTTDPAPESIIISSKEAGDNQQIDGEKENEKQPSEQIVTEAVIETSVVKEDIENEAVIQTEAQNNENKAFNQTLVEDNEANMQVESKNSENETNFHNEAEGQSTEVTLRKSDSDESLD